MKPGVERGLAICGTEKCPHSGLEGRESCQLPREAAPPCPDLPGSIFTFSAWLSSSLLLSLSLWGGSGPRPSSSNNCAFMVKSQAAVRSRALGLTGEGPYNETTAVRGWREAGEGVGVAPGEPQGQVAQRHGGEGGDLQLTRHLVMQPLTQEAPPPGQQPKAESRAQVAS